MALKRGIISRPVSILEIEKDSQQTSCESSLSVHKSLGLMATLPRPAATPY